MTDDSQTTNPVRRRRRLALAVPLVAVLIGAGSMVASTLIESPEERRAAAAPPDASLLTAPVEERVLASTLVTRGTVVPATRLEVTPVVEGAQAQVVTALHTSVGDPVQPGQTLVAVSGRPLIALPGKLPGYRDLKPGDNGADIAQLQTALRSLGHYHGGDRAGYFGVGTKEAVRRLYAAARYDVPDTGGPGGRADQAALNEARDAVDAAQDEWDALSGKLSDKQLPDAERKALSRQLDRLGTRLQRARRAQAELVASTGPMVPHTEYVFVPEFPARVAGVTAKVGEKVQAPLLTLAVGRLGVLVRLRPDQANLVRPGMAATVTSESLGKKEEGTVSTVGALTTDPKNPGPPFHPLMLDARRPLDGVWADLDVRVGIVSAETATKVLVVPLSAVSAGADGRTTVSVLVGAGETRRVEVRAGMSGSGFVEVTPLVGELANGDSVVVGAAG